MTNRPPKTPLDFGVKFSFAAIREQSLVYVGTFSPRIQAKGLPYAEFYGFDTEDEDEEFEGEMFGLIGDPVRWNCVSLCAADGPALRAAPLGANDDPDDADVALDADESLPWPDHDRLLSWWQVNGARSAAGTRHFAGQPPSPAHVASVLADGVQRQRVLAADVMVLLRPGSRRFNTAAAARHSGCHTGVVMCHRTFPMANRPRDHRPQPGQLRPHISPELAP